MTPSARAAAAIAILDEIVAGRAAEPALLAWARSSRFAGSGDRAAVRDLVFDCLRRRRSRAALGGGANGRALMLGACREAGTDPATVFGAGPHAPAPLTPQERSAGRPPDAREALDLPDWIIDRLKDDLADDLPAVAAAMRERAPVWLRMRRDGQALVEMLEKDGIGVRRDPRCSTALLVVSGARRIAGSAAYTQRLVELQDLSPQIACAMVPLEPGDSVLDYCAGGGGKALALAARGGAVTAWDRDAGRMRDLPARARRAGDRIDVAPKEPDGTYDVVVTDVPCSGSGTWRRTPDARWLLTPERLAALTGIQDTILSRAAERVRPGGTLAYMTCSLFTVENEARIEGFLDRHRNFRRGPAMRMTPLGQSDGFFVALLPRVN